MKTKITIIILGLFLISIASAVNYTIEAGESIVITLPESYTSYNITGNSSEVYITQNGLDVNITTSKYENNNFEILFFNEKEEIITKHSGGGWGRPNKLINTTNQTQQENSSISSEKDANFSSPADLPPILNISNNVNPNSKELNKQTKNFFESILNFLKDKWLIIFGIGIGIFLVYVIFYIFRPKESYSEGFESIKSVYFPDENQTTN